MLFYDTIPRAEVMMQLIKYKDYQDQGSQAISCTLSGTEENREELQSGLSFHIQNGSGIH
jgi:hypothetical protein